MSLVLRPIGVREASRIVERLHRHLPRIVGGLFAVAVYLNDELVGVAVASRPKARLSDDGFTFEITRVAVADGNKNACSKLYGSLCRAAQSVGFRRAITFTRLDEPGTSLKAAGFTTTGETREQSWDRPQRGRVKDPRSVRRWERSL